MCDCGTKAKALAVAIVIAIVLITAVVLIATSLKTLESYEVGLKYNTVTKGLNYKPVYEGLHAGPPGFKFIKFPNIYKTKTFSNLACLNQDGVKIYLDIGFQYRLQSVNLGNIVTQFRNNKGFKKMLDSLGTNAIMNSCSQFNTSEFQSRRDDFKSDLLTQITTNFVTVACEVTDLQIIDIRRPSEYEGAIRAKESARENIQVATNERPRQITTANTLRREAETRYTININRAETDARIIINRAQTEAAAILNQFNQEAETYGQLSQALGLDTSGFLSYLGVRTLESASNPVYIGLDAPARSNWMPSN